MRSLLLIPFLATAALANPPEPKFRAQTIDDQIEIGYGVAAADVDGDGKTDILVADKRRFVWYRNPTWERFVLAENLTRRDNVCIAAQDIDGDGKCEVAVGGDWDPSDRENSGAVFFLIPPADRTQRWEPVKLHAEPTVHRMRWLKLEEGGWGLVVAPLHGRGRDGAAPSKILLYHPPEDVRGEWKTEVLDESMHATHNFDVWGRSLLIAGREGVLRVDRDAAGVLKKTAIRPVPAAGEVGGHGTWIATIEPMHGNVLAVYDRDKRWVLTDRMTEGHALKVDSFLLPTGSVIVVGWRGKGGGLSVFTPSGLALDDGREAFVVDRWREAIVDDGGMACEDLCLADLNADGHGDIIASGRATMNVKVYWNETGAAAAGQ